MLSSASLHGMLCEMCMWQRGEYDGSALTFARFAPLSFAPFPKKNRDKNLVDKSNPGKFHLSYDKALYACETDCAPLDPYPAADNAIRKAILALGLTSHAGKYSVWQELAAVRPVGVGLLLGCCVVLQSCRPMAACWRYKVSPRRRCARSICSRLKTDRSAIWCSCLLPKRKIRYTVPCRSSAWTA